jgi:hypothetical protein
MKQGKMSVRTIGELGLTFEQNCNFWFKNLNCVLVFFIAEFGTFWAQKRPND